MRELATLRIDTGREVRVEVVREETERDEIVVRRIAERDVAPTRDLIAVIDAHLPMAVARLWRGHPRALRSPVRTCTAGVAALVWGARAGAPAGQRAQAPVLRSPPGTGCAALARRA